MRLRLRAHVLDRRPHRPRHPHTAAAAAARHAAHAAAAAAAAAERRQQRARLQQTRRRRARARAAILPAAAARARGGRAAAAAAAGLLLAAALHEPIDTIRLSSTKWADQFREAVAYDGDGPLSLLAYLLSLPWKVPPPHLTSPPGAPPHQRPT